MKRFILALASAALISPAYAADYFPAKGEAWTTHTPQQEHLDSAKLKAALSDLVARRRAITDLQAQRATREEEIKNIDMEQARIRQNMAQLDRNNPLYQQYVTKLTAQETRIEKLREEIALTRDKEAAAQKELRAYVDALTLA